MQTTKNFESAQKPAVEPTLQGGNVVVPGDAVVAPSTSIDANKIDPPKSNVADIADQKDGNMAPKPLTDAQAAKAEPTKN